MRVWCVVKVMNQMKLTGRFCAPGVHDSGALWGYEKPRAFTQGKLEYHTRGMAGMHATAKSIVSRVETVTSREITVEDATFDSSYYFQATGSRLSDGVSHCCPARLARLNAERTRTIRSGIICSAGPGDEVAPQYSYLPESRSCSPLNGRSGCYRSA